MDERESEKRFLEAYRQTDYERPSVVANIRRKVAALVEETEEFTEGAVHRPAKLYRREAV